MGRLFTDFLEDPDLSGDGWAGFTRDYQQFEGIWDDAVEYCVLDLEEYLLDLSQYKDGKYDYQETADMIKNLMSFLREAQDIGADVTMQIEE